MDDPTLPDRPVPDAAADIRFDHGRAGRIGIPEAVYSEGKSAAQLTHLIGEAVREDRRLLLTRLGRAAHDELDASIRSALDYDERSRTAVVGDLPQPSLPAAVAIVTAGTVDLPAGREAERTLAFGGVASTLIADVGVAGLWRLLERVDDIAGHPIVIAVAGMEAALFSVLGGLVPSAIIAVPTSHGYGVADGGRLALHSALSSCSPGVVVCNIDNGYGAACAALRILGARAGALGG